MVNSGVITFNFPYYVNSKDNISQNAGKLDIIVNGEDGFYINFFTYEKEFFHQKRGIPLYLTRVNGESMVSLGVGITFFCFFILFTILIAIAANPSDSGSLRFLFLLLMYMLAAFCAFFDITPLNSSFETLNRIITKIVNNDSIYIIVAKWEDAINNKDFYNL